MKGSRASQWRFEEVSGTGGDDPRVVAAVQEYLTALERGETPSREKFLARHAEIAHLLEHCLEGLELVHDAICDMQQDSPATPVEIATGHPQRPLGDFHIVREIGRGGMGIVYEAIQLSLGRRVAVKVLPFASALDPMHLLRFQNEAHAAAQLHHTNIVPIYAVGSDRGVHFYAMQLIDGHSLSELIRQLRRMADKSIADEAGDSNSVAAEILLGSFIPLRCPLGAASPDDTSLTPQPRPEHHDETESPASTVLSAEAPHSLTYFRTVAGLIRQAATALEHAHRSGVVHRDIKPANLLLDQRGNMWITDFGLAQADVQLTRTGDMLGTLRYMSPEQAMGDRAVLDHRTDIYSLGVTLYELLTLEPAIAGTERPRLLRQVLDEEPPAPRSHDKNIPVALETIVLKAIAKAPAERYATAQHFADDLERWLEDKPILARRPTLWEHAARWRRRHRAVVGASVAFLFLSLLGLLATTILIAREHGKTTRAYRRETAQRAAAEESFRQAREAVDTFSQLGEEEMANTPEMLQLRRKILQTALEYYNSFLDQRHDDASAQAELAAASDRIARIVDELSVLEGFAPMMLLSDTRVQQELTMTSTQREQIDKLLSQLMAERDRLGPTPRQLGIESRQQQLVEVLRSRQEQIVRVLSREQMQRLHQIAWQQRVPFAFKYPEVISALNLSPRQRQRISEIIEEERPAGPDHRGPKPGEFRPPPDRFGTEPWARNDHAGPEEGEGPDEPPPPRRRPPGHPHSMRATIDRTVSRIQEVLTPEQRAKWNALVGAPFLHDLGWGPHDWLPR